MCQIVEMTDYCQNPAFLVMIVYFLKKLSYIFL
jgi:hypothetical protein